MRRCWRLSRFFPVLLVEAETARPTAEPEPTIARTLEPGQYMAENGVIYTPEGYSSAEGNSFTFKKGFSASILDYTGKDFNRVTIRYSSTKALKFKLTYKVGDRAVDDAFFLEAGENVTFNGLILGYLNGDCANSIESRFHPACAFFVKNRRSQR